MKKIALILSLFLSFSYGRMVGGIALTVNGECVTTEEIHTLQQKAHISKKQAIDLLIQDRLQKSAMKHITIPESDIDKEISRIAEQNGFTIKKMQQLLSKQGTSWSKYRESIRNALKQRKFFQETVAKNIPQPTENELKRFYEKHQSEFKVPATISVIEYSAPTEAKLKTFLKTKSTKGIKHKRLTKKTKSLNSAMLGMLLQTPNGSFTAPMNAGDRWVIYKVLSKDGRTQMPFEHAKGAVAARWRQEQQGKAVKDYFQKMKTEANIQYLRK